MHCDKTPKNKDAWFCAQEKLHCGSDLISCYAWELENGVSIFIVFIIRKVIWYIIQERNIYMKAILLTAI